MTEQQKCAMRIHTIVLMLISLDKPTEIKKLLLFLNMLLFSSISAAPPHLFSIFTNRSRELEVHLQLRGKNHISIDENKYISRGTGIHFLFIPVNTVLHSSVIFFCLNFRLFLYFFSYPNENECHHIVYSFRAAKISSSACMALLPTVQSAQRVIFTFGFVCFFANEHALTLNFFAYCVNDISFIFRHSSCHFSLAM